MEAARPAAGMVLPGGVAALKKTGVIGIGGVGEVLEVVEGVVQAGVGAGCSQEACSFSTRRIQGAKFEEPLMTRSSSDGAGERWV